MHSCLFIENMLLVLPFQVKMRLLNETSIGLKTIGFPLDHYRVKV